MQCLKSGLQFNVSEGSVSTNNHIRTNLFDLAIAFGGWELNCSWIENCYLLNLNFLVT